MSEPISQKPSPDDQDPKLKIYFLPNLLTAGNLFCGFVALTKIVEADPTSAEYFGQIKLAIAFILLAGIFDLFDGCRACMGGVESPFGREFDSLADLISFGVAPAFLVQRIVLRDVFIDYPPVPTVAVHRRDLSFMRRVPPRAVQLSRGDASRKESEMGDFWISIPSAAGLVASLTLLIIHFNEKEKVSATGIICSPPSSFFCRR